MQTMDQFSHDLTLALEETSRTGGVRAGRWGARRRTRSTGNLPCAPQPTEDSSSSPTDAGNDIQNNQNPDGLNNSILSDSDDRHDLPQSLKNQQLLGNFESDSLNENFSPARIFRPNTRRKRKFKRMAVEYETTPSTPGAPGENATNPIFPVGGTIKKRVLKHTAQENFCGKRKRSHRDRYYDHDHAKLHSSSVPRHRDIYAPKSSYQEHKIRTRSFSTATKPSFDRILPLNKNIISKIERISQQQKPKMEQTPFTFTPVHLGGSVVATTATTSHSLATATESIPISNPEQIVQLAIRNAALNNSLIGQSVASDLRPVETTQQPQKSGSFGSSFTATATIPEGLVLNKKQPPGNIELVSLPSRRKHKRNRIRREQLRAQLRCNAPNPMDCSDLNDFLSSSSLSSSESEGAETNESDREGDDELTDWPGNEVMVNLASKNDFKRKSSKKPGLPQIKSDDYAAGIDDDDTLMSADEPIGSQYNLPNSTKPMQSQPIAIAGSISGVPQHLPIRQIESEMSGETSNHFLSSPPSHLTENREIRAGCRRIREGRPGFTIMTSVNERLARFLQDGRQSQLRLPEIEVHEHEKLLNLAKLYSLQMSVDNGCAVLTKTSNTTQSVKIDQSHLGHRFFMSDYKRRCFDFPFTDANDNSNDEFGDDNPLSGDNLDDEQTTSAAGQTLTQSFGMIS